MPLTFTNEELADTYFVCGFYKGKNRDNAADYQHTSEFAENVEGDWCLPTCE